MNVSNFHITISHETLKSVLHTHMGWFQKKEKIILFSIYFFSLKKESAISLLCLRTLRQNNLAETFSSFQPGLQKTLNKSIILICIRQSRLLPGQCQQYLGLCGVAFQDFRIEKYPRGFSFPASRLHFKTQIAATHQPKPSKLIAMHKPNNRLVGFLRTTSFTLTGFLQSKVAGIAYDILLEQTHWQKVPFLKF